MKYLLITLITMGISFYSALASDELESLKSLQFTNNDSAQIEVYFKIADHYYRHENDIENFGLYAKKSNQLASKINNKFLIAESLRYKGRYFSYANNLDSSLYYLKRSSIIFQEIPDSLQLASTFNSISDVYFRNYEEQLAIDYIIKTIKIYEELGKEEEMVVPLYNFAMSFNRLKDYEKSLSYFLKANEAANKGKAVKPYHKASILCQIARSYGNLYEEDVDSFYLDSTYKYATLALNYSTKNDLKISELSALDIIYGYYHSKYQFDKAIEILDVMIEKSIGFSDKHLCSAYVNKSNLLLAINKPKSAAILADSALKVAIRMDWKSHIMYAYGAIYESNKAFGNYPKAIDALEKYHQLDNEILNLETTTAINDLEQKYQSEKKENTIKELEQKKLVDEKEKQLQQIKIKKQNWIIIGLILIAITIGLIIWLITKQQKLKKDRLIIETKHKLLRSQMNPHFLFNGFTAVQRSIMKDENKINSITHLSEFSRLMRSVLESSFNEFVTLDNEVKLLNNYLSLQRFRFDDSFEYTIEIDDKINSNTTLIPPMLLQPFLENSIEHGRGNNDFVLKVIVSFKIVNQQLQIDIIDNGIGINKTNIKHSDHTSRAMSIVQERLKLLEPLLGKASLEIINISDIDIENSGVQIKIQIPLKTK